MNTFISVALLAISALPPHALNESIGGRNGNQRPQRVETVRENILNSRVYDVMVKAAVAMAQEQRLLEDIELKNLSFGQRTRLILAREFDDIDYVKEWQPSTERGFGSPSGPLPPHPLDKVIGEEPQSAAAVLKSLRESRVFADIIHQAARESEPLRRGLAGLNYAESVRTAIARAMQEDVEAVDSPGTDRPVPDEGALRDELKQLQGTWDFVFMQRDGKPRDIVGRRYTFQGNQVSVHQGDQTLETVSFQLDPTTNPKSLHIDFDVRVNDKRVGAHGIYELDGDTLTVCTIAAVLPRPTEFESKAGSNQWLVVMKRATR